MADFIAVIRRAVDGLSDNTPEMRVRVYERARSAVQRQLDNMKPRPADDVIARQLEKLDDAIATIESEFSGAPAPAAVIPAAPEPEPVEEVAPPPPAPPQPEPEPEPQPEPEPEPAPRYVAPEPVAHEPPAFLRREPAPVVVERPKPEPEFTPAPQPETKFEAAPQPVFVEPVADEPEEGPAAPEDDTMPPAADETDTSWRHDPFEEPLSRREPVRTVEQTWEPVREPVRGETDFARPLGFDPTPAGRPADADVEPWTPVVTDNPFHEPAEIFTPKASPEPVARADDVFAVEKPRAATAPQSWWEEVEAAPVPPMPSAMPSAPKPDASWDNFEAFVGERSTGRPLTETAAAKPPRGRDGMSIGQQEPPRDTPKEPPVPEDREGRGKLIAGIVAAVIVLAGAGYAGWRFSDSILALVNGTSSTSSQTASKSQPASGQQTTTPAAATKPAAGTTAPATTPVVTGPQKFTQRLMADGSEVDSGASGEQVA
ncbi:MAG TPA: hypothetical protein VN112_00830, partial [Ensifer sp.]|nr:hypothetical protein [Ensifer sp.]